MGFLDSLLWVCFPHGFHVEEFSQAKGDRLCKHDIVHFTLTQEEGSKLYATVLLFNELALAPTPMTVPKSVCLISK